MSELDVENFVKELNSKDRLHVGKLELTNREAKEFLADDLEEDAVNGIKAFFQDLKKKLCNSEERNGKIFVDGKAKVMIPNQQVVIKESEIQEFVDTMKKHKVEIDVIKFYGEKDANN